MGWVIFLKNAILGFASHIGNRFKATKPGRFFLSLGHFNHFNHFTWVTTDPTQEILRQRLPEACDSQGLCPHWSRWILGRCRDSRGSVGKSAGNTLATILPGLFLLVSRVAMIYYIYTLTNPIIIIHINTSRYTYITSSPFSSVSKSMRFFAFEPGYFNGSKDGDTITAIAFEAQLAATGEAFALYRCGGDRVLTWGNPRRRWRNGSNNISKRCFFFRHNGDLTMENGDLTSKDWFHHEILLHRQKTGDFAKTHWWGPSLLAKKMFTTWLTLGFLAV